MRPEKDQLATAYTYKTETNTTLHLHGQNLKHLNIFWIFYLFFTNTKTPAVRHSRADFYLCCTRSS